MIFFIPQKEPCKKPQSLSCRLNIEDRGLDDIEDRGSRIKPQRIDPFPIPQNTPPPSPLPPCCPVPCPPVLIHGTWQAQAECA